MRLVAQLVELDPTTGQLEVFYRHSEARRIARNDLIAEYKKRKERDGKVIIKELRPWFNAVKDRLHVWMRSCSQNAVKGGLIDAVDALTRFFKGQNTSFLNLNPKASVVVFVLTMVLIQSRWSSEKSGNCPSLNFLALA